MGRTPRRQRNSAVIRESLNKRLNLYALAASAAGVGLLGMPGKAGAQIIFTPVNVTVGAPGGSYDLDLNNDGITDFIFRGYGGSANAFLDINVNGANEAIQFTKTCNGTLGTYCTYAAALVAGAKIPGKRLAPDFAPIEVANQFQGKYSYRGVWEDVKNHYLGLKFQINGQTHYGWVRMSVQVQGASVTAHVTGYAYESTPDKAIRAGDRGTLGALARGVPAR